MSKADSRQKEKLRSAELTKVAQRYLRAMAGVATVFYLLRGASYSIEYDESVAAILGWPALATSAFALGIFYFSMKKELSRFFIESVFFTFGCLMVFNLFWNFHYDINPVLLTNVAFVIIAIGLGTTLIWNWAAQVTMTCVTYMVAAHYYQIDNNIYVIVFTLLSGFLLSLLAYLARVPVVRELVNLEVELVDKAEKIEEASKAKDRFLANMTHELRTPLTGVVGMIELMEDTQLDGEQQFLLNNAHKSAGYLLKVVNDILDFSKLEAGKLELKPALVDLLAVCRDAVAVFEAQARGKELNLVVNLPDLARLPVVADGVRIGQVLINLIGNAIKFTDQGEIIVTLEWNPSKKQGTASFIVSDTGAGIAADKVGRLFGRFEQVDDSVTRTATGTGLGLAICKELVVLMGGSIGVDSEPEKGSCFTFQLELPYDNTAGEISEATKGGRQKWSKENAKRGRVLLAEDNAINQVLITKLLELEGVEVVLAENGEKAVQIVQQSGVPFDLIFLDVQMPVMDGVSAARIIRQSMPEAPPIIAITANTQEQDVQDYSEAGMVGVLGKPLDRKKLREVLFKYCSVGGTAPS